MCEFKTALDKLNEHEDPLFKDYNLVKEIFIRDKTYWFKNQTVIWNDRFQPEMFNFLGRSGHGFSFNMMEPSKMFRDEYDLCFLKILTSKCYFLTSKFLKNFSVFHQTSPKFTIHSVSTLVKSLDT